jgi:hypothetical protein
MQFCAALHQEKTKPGAWSRSVIASAMKGLEWLLLIVRGNSDSRSQGRTTRSRPRSARKRHRTLGEPAQIKVRAQWFFRPTASRVISSVAAQTIECPAEITQRTLASGVCGGHDAARRDHFTDNSAKGYAEANGWDVPYRATSDEKKESVGSQQPGR